jgi:uncharacterized repeat protein (TIGR02543 family)
MKKKYTGFFILIMICATFFACEDMAELFHGPKPLPQADTRDDTGGVTYTVTFNVNGGSGTAPAAQTASSGSAITLPHGDGLSRTGYTFSGWNTAASGTGTNYGGGSSYNVTGNITLYARWVDASTVWTVKFETSGGSAVGDAVVLRNTAVGRPAPDPTKTGYTFDNWYTNAGLTAPYNFSSIITGNITLYAKWNPITYTVTYNKNADGAAGATANSSHTYDVDKNLTANGFTYTGYAFTGWSRTSTGAVEFTNGQSVKNLTATAGETVTLYAVWNSVPGSTLAAKLSWLQTNAMSNVDYVVDVTADESISPTTLSYSGRTNIGITLRGTGAIRTVSLSSVGSLFTVGNGVTLVLDNNITLQGRSANNASLVKVNSGGRLVMNTGSTVTGNSSSDNGGGVHVNSGTFTMNGGEISGNTYSNPSGYFAGGGVYVDDGTFTMSGGKISGNTSSNGGGVSVAHKTFTMSGGEISGNTAYNGGGVYVFMGTFTMSGTAKISGNIASNSYGGGVYVQSYTCTMSGGEISGNTASGSYASGGGVYEGGTFTMSGGTIFGNTVISDNGYGSGGGVYVRTFTKTGGTIYGYSASDTVNSNVVKNSSGTVQSDRGHTVFGYIDSSSNKRRETTAGTGVNLSFDGSVDPPTFSGGWED